MTYLNKEGLERIFQKGKKILLQKVAPFALTAGIMAGVATPSAHATSIHFNDVTISEEEYVIEKEYASSDLNSSDYRVVKDEMTVIYDYFTNFYRVLANGGLDTNQMGSKSSSLARLDAHITQIQDIVKYDLEDEKSTIKTPVNQYLQSKINEAKLLYSSYMNISINKIEDFSKNYSCNFTNAVGNNTGEIAIYEENSHSYPNYIYYDDSNLSQDKAIIKMPRLEVSGKSNPQFNTVYEALVVKKSIANTIQDSMKKANSLYNHIEEALNSGNYTINKNQNDYDIMVAIYGDMNVVNRSINQAYANNSQALQIAKDYLSYREDNLVAKVYQKNKNNVSYKSFGQFAEDYSSLRTGETRSNVYYDVTHNGRTTEETIKNQGYLKMSDLSIDGNNNPVYPNNPTTWYQNITMETGINIYVDGGYFYPRDANGNYVKPMIYNGTTYVPIRAISQMFGADVSYSNKTVSVKQNPVPVYDQYGNVIYQGNQIPDNLDRGRGTASTKRQKNTIQVEMGIKIMVDGAAFVPKDANGNIVPVLFYNGTVMVPARALVEKLGGTISYDANINGVRIADGFTNNLVYPEYPQYPTYPEAPTYPEYPINSDSFIEAQDQNGNLVNIYIDNSGRYYLMQGNQKIYIPNLNGYIIDGTLIQKSSYTR